MSTLRPHVFVSWMPSHMRVPTVQVGTCNVKQDLRLLADLGSEGTQVAPMPERRFRQS